MEALKPCPFCGGTINVYKTVVSMYGQTFCFTCELCGTEIKMDVPVDFHTDMYGFDPVKSWQDVTDKFNQRAERKKGEWEFGHMTGERSFYADCSECGHRKHFEDIQHVKCTKFCEICGTELDWKEE